MLGQIRDAEAAAQVELGDLVAVGVADAGHELHHDRRRLAEGVQREDLRTDVAVQAHQAHVLSGQHVADALEGEVLAHGEAELRVLATGADVLVGVGLNAGGDAHVHVLHHAEAPGDLVHAGQLDAGIKHDAPHAGGDGLFQLVGRLVVAVDEHALHGEVYRAGAGQLAAARHIQAQPLGLGDAHHFLVQERLRRVNDVGILVAAAEGLAVGLHAVTQVGLVEHVERGALLAGQLYHVDAADEQVVVAHLGGLGQHGAQLHSGAHIGLLRQV